MPFVTVDMWIGRTPEQKRLLVEGITNVFVKIGTRPETVQILLNEHMKSQWAVNGKLGSEENK